MKQMWAPWRMPYIQQHEPEPGCIFCTRARAEDDEPFLIVHRSERCFVMLNLYPYNSGHLLVIPYQHASSLVDLSPDVGQDMFLSAQLTTRALSDAFHPEGFNLGINQGAVAGAGVADHLHLHVVPRWNGDTNFMPVLTDAKVMPELLTATAAKLRPFFQQYSSRQ